ncbi:MAG: dipeptide ABC transporter ATP-binding protein [Candidatus Tectomicrobia bacterium]|nr:dipeptide ABC transporter ATP-binding protein [Candidatus Tectomicrobia bacterium]
MLLHVNNLKTYFRTDEGLARAVDGVSFTVEEGESLVLVGESGCGKTVCALSLMRLIQKPGYHPEGEIVLEGTDLLKCTDEELRHIRGNRISMVFQEPMSSLNPVFSIGNQIMEPLMLHQKMDKLTAQRRSVELLDMMGVPSPDIRLREYPHQLSGGMRQRVMIAMALACRPRLLIADEPTTSIDVTVQAQILHLIKELQEEIGMSLILITHDLGVVNEMADQVCVMYAGKVAEIAPRQALFEKPSHPYTIKLFESIPRGVQRKQHLKTITGTVRPATQFPEGCRFAERCPHASERCTLEAPSLLEIEEGHSVSCYLFDPDDPLQAQPALDQKEVLWPEISRSDSPLIEIHDLKTYFPVKKGFFQRTVGYLKAVDGVSLTITQGSTVGLVGESGCGKTTLGHTLLKLVSPTSGKVLFEGKDLLKMEGAELRSLRRDLQIVFQDPFSSLSPRMLVKDIIEEGMKVHKIGRSEEERIAKVDAVLQEVGLDPTVKERYPHEFSGGQRQRIAIARALVLNPKFLILDEATSSLDVSVQAQILNLLRQLQVTHDLTYLFITHDLGVVEYLATDVAVMYLGRIVEYGKVEEIFAYPRHPYTQSLLSAVPRIDSRREPLILLQGDVPSPINPPTGCHFHPRCPLLQQSDSEMLKVLCHTQYPSSHQTSSTHWAACHAVDSRAAL